MALSLDAAAEVFREAMRDTVKRYSLWYLIQGILLIAAGMLAIIYPVISSGAVVILLGWLLIISGVVQGFSLIGAGQVPHFWRERRSQLAFARLGAPGGRAGAPLPRPGHNLRRRGGPRVGRHWTTLPPSAKAPTPDYRMRSSFDTKSQDHQTSPTV